MSRISHGWPPFVCVIVTLLLGASGVYGQRPVAPSGYTVSVTNEWPSRFNGAIFVRLTIETDPVSPVAFDETFTVTVSEHQPRAAATTVKAGLTLKAGQSSCQVDLFLPMAANAFNSAELLVEIGEGDGKFTEGKDLLLTKLAMNLRQTGHYVNQTTALFVSSSFGEQAERTWVCRPGTTNMNLAMQPGGSVVSRKWKPPMPSITKMAIGLYHSEDPDGELTMTDNASLQMHDALHGCRPEDLPDAWIGLSGIQQIFVSFADFKLICLSMDSRRDCLEEWVAVGGTLVVYDLTSDYRELDKLFPFLMGRGRSGATSDIDRHWRIPGKDVLECAKLILMTPRSRYAYDEEDWVVKVAAEVDSTDQWSRIDATHPMDDLFELPPWVIGKHLNGRVVAVNDDMQDWSEASWRGLYNGLTMDSNWMVGEIGGKNDGGFIRGFTVPGVGEPPVSAFRWLIGLFLLIAGPLMFIVLRRTRQMQLLFVLVPILSLVSCLGLIGYAVVVDGFDLWGRVQSVIRIDQRTQSAVGHARSSYYTGSRPGPYVYSTDTLVMRSALGYSQTELVEQGVSSIAYSGGDIRPRTPHQIVTVRSFQTDKRLVWNLAKGVTGTANGEQGLEVSVLNRLGAKVLYAVAKTGDEIFEIRNLDDGQQALGTLVEPEVANSELMRLVGQWSRQSFNGYGSSWSGYNVGNASWGHEDHVVERLSNEEGLELLGEPNTYVAIMEFSPLIADQIEPEPVKYKKQLHVIIGKW